jgi:hypothetical protein
MRQETTYRIIFLDEPNYSDSLWPCQITFKRRVRPIGNWLPLKPDFASSTHGRETLVHFPLLSAHVCCVEAVPWEWGLTLETTSEATSLIELPAGKLPFSSSEKPTLSGTSGCTNPVKQTLH